MEQAIAFRAAGGDAERREVQVAGLGQPARRPVSLGVLGQLPRERGVRPPARRDPVGQRLRPDGTAGRLPVQRRALGDADAAVDGSANAGVRELTAPAVDGGHLGEQARPDGLLERGQRIGQVRERRGVGEAAPGTEHGGGGNQVPCLPEQPASAVSTLASSDLGDGSSRSGADSAVHSDSRGTACRTSRTYCGTPPVCSSNRRAARGGTGPAPTRSASELISATPSPATSSLVPRSLMSRTSPGGREPNSSSRTASSVSSGVSGSRRSA